MFFEVQDWLRAGKPVPTGGESPLALAAGKGFHSLVKVLLDQGASQDMLDAALNCAGAGGHLETCRLLLERGAGVGGVRAADVLDCGNREVADMLTAAGMDVENGDALAKALVELEPQALAFFRRWKRRRRGVRRQGAMAFRHAVLADDFRVAQRLRRIGCDPRIEVPELFPRYKGHNYDESALASAVLSGSIPMVMQIGIRNTDNVQEFLKQVWISKRETILFLLKHGAVLNERPDGGSSLLHRAIIGQGHSWSGARSQAAKSLVRELVKMGAKWVPDRVMVHDTRLFLKRFSSTEWVELVELLVKSGAATRETCWALLNTPAYRKRLGKDMVRIKEIVKG